MTSNRASAYLDSSVIVRYLANDPPEMADRATEIIEKQTGLIVTEHILAESAFILQSVYGIPRPDLVDALMEFVRHENIQLAHIEKSIILQALVLCRDSKRVSFADALLWSEAFSSPGRSVYTFDQKFPATGISIIKSD